jgi:hypothetical protein
LNYRRIQGIGKLKHEGGAMLRLHNDPNADCFLVLQRKVEFRAGKPSTNGSRILKCAPQIREFVDGLVVGKTPVATLRCNVNNRPS